MDGCLVAHLPDGDPFEAGVNNDITYVMIKSDVLEFLGGVRMFLDPVGPGRQVAGQVMELHSRSTLDVPDVFEGYFAELVDFLGSIFILHILDWEVDFLLEVVLLEVRVVLGDCSIDLLPQSDTRLVCPASRYIFNRIASPAQQDSRKTKRQHVLQAVAMPSQT